MGAPPPRGAVLKSALIVTLASNDVHKLIWIKKDNASRRDWRLTQE
jgi:hypothetical protein